ncbi:MULTISPECIES: SLATT domain-containing protein [Rhodococcus]|uniref:SLATT domain-containing protein n=1 Tax=Rhodococcus TaxID=1827 RepID=UPI00193BA373|nr:MULTISPECIES: SLATT domain-containing protein [Rhodococcus]QRI76703.1 SLATT domain-containing protein [Rhodococcus aetherivorans]QSE60122.1 SLATT domain-containing protein [Rhodococcus sp. PSBB066]QSE68573.1 SLATT domain-containing protein [Rhodococcus sp. PSBB049]
MAVIIIIGLIAYARMVDARIHLRRKNGVKVQKPIDLLGQRSYDSYRCRLEASRRLKKLGHWWNAAQFSLPTALIFVSIFSLSAPGDPSAIARVVIGVSVLSLVASVVVTFLDYSARAKALEINYRALQAFSVRIETMLASGKDIADDGVRLLQLEYDWLLDKAENHSSVDYKTYKGSKSRFYEKRIPTLLPGLLVLLSIGVIVFAIIGMFQSGG